jgi:hypothetical protein
MRGATDLPILAYPNSGEAYDTRTRRWRGRPAGGAWIGRVPEWVHAGASAIGGCCRVGPDVIAGIRRTLEQMEISREDAMTRDWVMINAGTIGRGRRRERRCERSRSPPFWPPWPPWAPAAPPPLRRFPPRSASSATRWAPTAGSCAGTVSSTYYDSLDVLSDRIVVERMGPSTFGNPFLVIFVSSPENLAQIDAMQERNAVLQDPRGRSEADIRDAIVNGKVVFVQSYGLHSTEVAGTQSAAEVMHDFATRDDDVMREILDNTLSIIIPNFNPDGSHIVSDWYDRWVGTEYEGSSPPELYHHYIGHDNNRDAFMQNTVESRYGAQILFRDWIPQAFIDHHQMGRTPRASICRPTPSRSARRPIRSCGARWRGTAPTWRTRWRRRR